MFKQSNIKMYITTMNIEELVANSFVAHYDSQTGEDYQRPPVPSHYRKIAQYFINDNNPILPSAIIAAISESKVKYDEAKAEIMLLDKLRIVDGQHRIEGIKALKNFSTNGARKYEDVKMSFGLPVIIMEIKPADEIVEIDAFINLNSKGKRVKTDLAEALKAKKISMKNKGDLISKPDADSIAALSMDIVRRIGNKKECFWKNIIIMPDENGNRNKQPISSLAFQRAIKPIVSKYLMQRDTNGLTQEDVENEIISIIEYAWNCVTERWKECFSADGKYDERYNICKGIGVVPLFNILAEKGMSVNDEINADCVKKYKELLEKSEVKSSDWYIGGTFSGLSSQSGFKRIERFILGEISRDELYGDY